MKKAIALFALAISIGFMGGQKLTAFYADNVGEFGFIRQMANGLLTMYVGSNPAADNSWRIQQASSTANGVTPYTVIVSTNGGVQFNGAFGSTASGPSNAGVDLNGGGNGSYYPTRLSTGTSTQLGAQTPLNGAGEMVFNVTRGIICVSTGTAKGAFANAASTSAVLNTLNQGPCYP